MMAMVFIAFFVVLQMKSKQLTKGVLLFDKNIWMWHQMILKMMMGG
jgi:hypothetical protein